ncbi:MAG: ATP-binding cassette domain-containing protein [Anaerolineae bacterium]
MSILLERLTKRFGNLPVVENINLEIAEGEMFVLLGASGSGKSTVLRMIAGLTDPDAGRILLHGRDVTSLPPQQRGTGFVFQNYSIFRHMSVADNIEFGLKIRKVPAAERVRRREELLDMVGLAGLGGRYADQLSGGQRQRVALARALAYEPKVLLLDEPFGALDVKIRAQLRRNLKDIQDRLGITTVLVTHDQEEAFELADRIGVIDRGLLLEVGDPESLYHAPRTLFTATFLGAGVVLAGRVQDGRAVFGSLALPIPAESAHEEGSRVRVLFRPEQVILGTAPPTDGSPILGPGAVIDQTFSGSTRRLRLRLPRLSGARQVAPPAPFGEEGLLVDATAPADTPMTQPDWWVSLRGWHILAPMPQRLLVCDPGEGPTVKLEAASRLAERLWATVTVLGVCREPEGMAELRETLAARAEAAGLGKAEIRVRYGAEADEILAEQSESVYDYVIMGIGGNKPDAERPGNVVTHVLERAKTPVWVVKGQAVPLENILLCTAGGEPGKSDVRVGGRLARNLESAVTLLYVARPAGDAGPVAQSHLERAAATLRSLDVPVSIKIAAAPTPAQGILAQAQSGYGLIIVGRHSPSRGFFGLDDVTRQVLTRADQPVLIVPAEEA